MMMMMMMTTEDGEDDEDDEEDNMMMMMMMMTSTATTMTLYRPYSLEMPMFTGRNDVIIRGKGARPATEGMSYSSCRRLIKIANQ